MVEFKNCKTGMYAPLNEKLFVLKKICFYSNIFFSKLKTNSLG